MLQLRACLLGVGVARGWEGGGRGVVKGAGAL